MRVVGIAIITALLSAGCAIQPGDPQSEEMQRPNELVGISGSDQPGVGARPQVFTRSPLGQTGPIEESPNPSPWGGQGNGDPHAGGMNGDPSGNGGSGSSSGGQSDNPNPSPWANPSGPHWGGSGTSGSRPGTGG
jgi:hypothetical protein